MPEDLIHTTAAVRCPLCGLTPHGEHERLPTAPERERRLPKPGEVVEAVCGVCYRAEIMLEPLRQEVEALASCVAKLLAKQFSGAGESKVREETNQ